MVGQAGAGHHRRQIQRKGTTRAGEANESLGSVAVTDTDPSTGGAGTHYEFGFKTHNEV